MSRLTKGSEKHNNEFISYVADVSLYPEMMGYEYEQADMDCINKLGKLEDIEEELGIDLITLFKALKDGIYIDLDNIVIFKSSSDLSLKLYLGKWYITYYHQLNGGTFYVDLKDKGKTWALSKNELEEQDDE